MPPIPAIEEIIVPQSDTLYLFFGGIHGGVAIPPFEFYHAADVLNCSRIFVRDLDQCWYHCGLRGNSDDIKGTARFLADHINAIQPQHLYFVGNSMGGFAALLFSALLGCGEVIAFAPQTFLSNDLRLLHQDKRWALEIEHLRQQTAHRMQLFDLLPVLQQQNSFRPIHLHVSREDALDIRHANHLSSIPQLTTHLYDEGGHDVVKNLRDQGLLPQIMRPHQHS